ncbi:MAG: sigma-54-dependent Fis family transcriptional regulator [Candidatus Eisenbacteria bacterium]|nr:sigma-54-dependent Fis family transcriptional regulator [Candidatus Eisenbacteria bacterium]
MRTRILVVDDEPLVRRSMERALADQGFDVLTAPTIKEAEERFEAHRPPVVVLDIKLPDGSGLDLLPRLRETDPAVKVVVVTAFGETAEAVKAMKLGAADFLKKPYDLAELIHAVRSAAESHTRDRQLKGYRRREQSRYAHARMIGRCPAMLAVRELVAKVALSDTATVLVTGESGTGKELVARAIHFESSRRGAPLMEVNCSTFQDALLENELFGHEKGAFTGASHLKRGLVELCDGGTLFLDEVSEMSARVQAKLLRFIDHRTFKRVGGSVDQEVDIRLVAATNARLDRRIAEDRFRHDLYFRLKVVSIELPPLRERGDDVVLLAATFLEDFSREMRKRFERIHPDAERLLRAYSWPGNVRELRNLIERVVLLEEGPELEARHLPEEIRRCGAPGQSGSRPFLVREDVALPGASEAREAGKGSLASEEAFALLALLAAGRPRESGQPLSLREVEDAYIALVLEQCGGNRSEAARRLRLSRQGLLDRLRRMADASSPEDGGLPAIPSDPDLSVRP